MTAEEQPQQETPRSVLPEACREICAPFGKSGFRYLKSGPRMTRPRNEWSETVKFHSDKYNMAGSHIGLWIYLSLENKRLEAWRKEQASLFGRTSSVAGGEIGQLRGTRQSLEWELVDPLRRPDVVANAIKTVEDVALPYFAKFSDIEALAHLLMLGDLPGLELSTAFELLSCYLGKPTAERFAVAWVNRHPDLRSAIERDVRRTEKEGLQWILGPQYPKDPPFHVDAFSKQIAVMATHCGVKWAE